MAQVVLEALVKAYPDKDGKEVRAVQGIDLTIEDKEFMVLVGPSGCGKSTTLRMIAGLEAVTAGTVKIDGVVVNDVPPKERDIAMVFQNYALYPHMTVFENMAFGLKLRKFPKAEIQTRVGEAAALLGLDDLLQRRPKALSGGQRQRVALGRAIVRKPKVFLFDEPLSNLDAKMRVAMRMELAKLRTRLQATMIYVTHDQVEAMTLGDRICVMQAGRILQVAPPMQLYREPNDRFVAGFIGSPPMNFIPSGDAAGVVWGIRPEHIQLADRPAGMPGEFAATVELVEPMGADAYVHTRLAGGATVVVRADPGSLRPLATGSSVWLRIDLGQVRAFDPKTGSALV